MLIRLFSDLHLDFDAEAFRQLPKYHPVRLARTIETDYLWGPPVLPTDKDTLLLLAGDLWTENRAFEKRYGQGSWIERMAKQFHSVALVLGNHDYWSGSLILAAAKAKKSCAHLPNVYVLECDAVVINDIKVVGATLWTSYNKGDPLVIMQAAGIMNDYAKIRVSVGGRKSRPNDMYAVHCKTVSWLTKHAVRDYPEQQLVVMTHMAPTYLSVPEKYKNAKDHTDNFLYFSDLDNTVLDLAPQLWVHGHIHTPSDYQVDTTRVLCNPRGYTVKETGYSEHMVIDLAANLVTR